MKRATLVFGIICTILSIAYLLKALQYPLGAMNKPGPGAAKLRARAARPGARNMIKTIPRWEGRTIKDSYGHNP